MDEFTVSIWHRGPLSVIACRGELDIATTPHLEDALEMTLDTLPSKVYVDAWGISLLTSSGVEVLLDAAQRCRRAGIAFQVGLGPRGRRIVDLLGCGDLLDVQPAVTVAVADDEVDELRRVPVAGPTNAD